MSEENFSEDLISILDAKGVNSILGIQDSLSDSKFIVPTGLLNLDILMGGGIHSGRLYEIYGPQSHGKSTLCDYLAIQWQKSHPKAIVFRVEVEGTLDKVRFVKQGGDLNRMILYDTLCLEKAYNEINSVMDAVYEKFGEDARLLVVVDTLTALKSKNSIEGNAFAGGMMEEPRINTREITKLNNKLAQYSHCMIVIQQIRQSTDGFSNEYDTTGGEALKHFYVFRCEVARKDPIFDPNDPKHIIGNDIEVTVRKNKLTGMEDKCTLVLYRMDGINPAETLAKYAMTSGKCAPYISLSGGWIKIKDHYLREYKQAQGMAKFAALVKEDPNIMKIAEYAAYNWYSNYHEIFAEKYRDKIAQLKSELDQIFPPAQVEENK